MKRVTTLCAIALLAAVALMTGAVDARAQFTRTVLLEEFTSVTCKPCTTATPIINKVVRDNGGRVLSIRYHMNFPVEGDPWYEANVLQNTGRAQYYNVLGLPYGRLDGATNVAVTSEGDVFDKVDDRLSQESPIGLEVSQVKEGNTFKVTVKATSGNQDLSGNYRLHVLALEAHIHDERFQGGKWNNEKDFEDVMRTMITGVDGAEFTIDADDERTFNFEYEPGADWQPDQMYVVAFVQNDITQQIAQASSSPKPVSGVYAPAAIAGYSLDQSFPNPARDEAMIDYTLGRGGAAVLELYDAAGRPVARFDQGTREVGTYRARLDLRGIPAGAYTVMLDAGGHRLSRMMTVVR